MTARKCLLLLGLVLFDRAAGAQTETQLRPPQFYLHVTTVEKSGGKTLSDVTLRIRSEAPRDAPHGFGPFEVSLSVSPCTIHLPIPDWRLTIIATKSGYKDSEPVIITGVAARRSTDIYSAMECTLVLERDGKANIATSEDTPTQVVREPDTRWVIPSRRKQPDVTYQAFDGATGDDSLESFTIWVTPCNNLVLIMALSGMGSLFLRYCKYRQTARPTRSLELPGLLLGISLFLVVLAIAYVDARTLRLGLQTASWALSSGRFGCPDGPVRPDVARVLEESAFLLLYPIQWAALCAGWFLLLRSPHLVRFSRSTSPQAAAHGRLDIPAADQPGPNTLRAPPDAKPEKHTGDMPASSPQ